MNPFHNRKTEWELYQPLYGKTMLELGNKQNGELVYKAFFESLGFKHISVDLNGKDGALSKDLQLPLELGTFDMVTNIGTSEHIANQEGVWRNIVEAMEVGGVLISLTPLRGYWKGHGIYYPTSEFYEQLSYLNGLLIERLFLCTEPPANEKLIAYRAVKNVQIPFVMPPSNLLYRE